jgi:hypothetical protein
LLGASFRPSLTTTPLRSATVHRYPVLCGLSPPVIKHAWHTRKSLAIILPGQVLNQSGSKSAGLCSARFSQFIALFEPIYASFSINNALLPGVKRVAVAANFYSYRRLCRSKLDAISANTSCDDFLVLWMNSLLHWAHRSLKSNRK